jgi:hypothetical protein
LIAVGRTARAMVDEIVGAADVDFGAPRSTSR